MLDNLESFFESLWHKFISDESKVDLSSPLPWDSWELDPAFFEAMSQWTIHHRETTLARVLDNICVGIDHGKDLVELIPDSPFPARGLVKALGYLVTLGNTVSRAKVEVHEFAEDIIQWVSDMQLAFKNGQGGHFTRKTKKNLAKMRTLLDEICKWATARLNDGRWSSITHGLSIAREIEQFKTRMASVRTIFMDLTMVNISQGLDKITQDIKMEIKIIRQLQLDQLKSIHDKLDAQMQAEERRRFLSQMLHARTVANATYDEQGKRPCDAGTRTVILADVDAWIHDFSAESQNFLWLTGDPGSGKSAITASVARECKNDGILWAQFFINRNNADTTDPRSYFPSIARQLADHITDSDVTLAIHGALRQKRALVDDISTEQASKLFIDAIEVACKLDPHKPVVIVIDGLDETARGRLRFTAEIFSNLFSKLRCRNAKVFISSRTEDDIQKPFSKAFDVKHVKHIHLDTSTESSIQDVSSFLGNRIAEIVENNDLNWEEWPGKERMQALCVRASGLFIWAATVVKFFREQIEAMGSECLNDLLDALSTEGMSDINTLYGTILRLVYKGRKNAWEFETFRRVVGGIVVLREPLCLAEIENLLDLRQNASTDRVDIKHFVRRLRTVLVDGTDTIDDQTVPRLHKSFFEFITSDRADRLFRVDTDTSNGELAIQCLRVLASFSTKHTARYNIHSSAEAMELLPVGLRYALQFGCSHWPGAKRASAGMAIVDNDTQLTELQKMLQFSSEDMKNSRTFGITFSPDKKEIAAHWDNNIHMWDTVNSQRINKSIQRHAGGVFSVAFSPDGLEVVSGNEHTVRVWDPQRQIMRPHFRGHTDCALSVAFSPDRNWIVSGSSDTTVRVWDSQTGQMVSIFNVHTGTVFSVAFSPDGEWVVSGSDDQTVCVWDWKRDKLIQKPFQGHTGGVNSVSFSPDGKQIVSCSTDHTVRLWDSHSGQLIGLPFQGHTRSVWSVAFSPDGRRLVSGSEDHSIRVWDLRIREAIRPAFKGHCGGVNCVAFSPDGLWIVSASDDNTIRIWGLDSGQCEALLRGHIERVWCVAFSPDGSRVVSGSKDQTVRFWDPQSGKSIGPPFQSQTAEVRSVAFSPDMTYLICVSMDDTVECWDLRSGAPMELGLEGNTKELLSITISPNGSRIAAVSLSGIVYLWDVVNYRLVSPPIESLVDGFKSLTFTPDGTQLILTCIDGSTFLWNAADGKPIHTSSSSDFFLSAKLGVRSFDVKQGWRLGEFNDSLLRWLPSNDPNYGVWAYIGGKVIRINGGDSVTIIDVNTNGESEATGVRL